MALAGSLNDLSLRYRRGAFTGADSDRAGLLREADGGTVLFDEAAELTPELQAKLLRVIDRKSVRPLGGVGEVKVDVRYLFATNQDLARRTEEPEA